MHGFLEAQMGDKTGLKPDTAIGPAVRTVAARILGKAAAAVNDAERSNQEAVHDFRRAMKEWRALMRLLAPFVPEAEQCRIEARDHARALAHARDGSAALHAFDDLLDKGLVLSARTSTNIRGRIEALRGSQEQAVMTPAQRDAIVGWVDGAATAMEQWPLDQFDFAAIAERLTAGYRRARKQLPADWLAASGEELHALRGCVVDHRYQMELIEPLWPRFGRMWTGEAERLRDRLGRCQDLEVLSRLSGAHQPLAHWRSRLAPACAERSAALAQRAGRIARRLFAEKPKAFRGRLEALWEQGP
jgi:CHAD domain-containing protein